jgi:hypothetical protein
VICEPKFYQSKVCNLCNYATIKWTMKTVSEWLTCISGFYLIASYHGNICYLCDFDYLSYIVPIEKKSSCLFQVILFFCLCFTHDKSLSSHSTCTLKGTVSRDFTLYFFHQKTSPDLLYQILKLFRILAANSPRF